MTGTLLLSAAILLRILSNPAANVVQKQLTQKGADPQVVNFLTYFLISLLSVFIAAFVDWTDLPSEFWLYSVMTGLMGALGNGFLVRALSAGELSVLGPVNSYKSVVGIIFGIILLGEIPGPWGILGILLIITGSYFVLDKPGEKFSIAILRRPDIQFRLIALIFTAIEAVFLKKVIIASSAVTAFISWSVSGAIFSYILLIVSHSGFNIRFQGIDNHDIVKYAILVICIFTMQSAPNFTLERMHVGYALSLFQLSAIINIILGHHVFRESNIRRKLLGSAIMITGSVLIILFNS